MNRRSSMALLGLAPFIAALQGCSDSQRPTSPVPAPSTDSDPLASLRSSRPPTKADVLAELGLPPEPTEPASGAGKPRDPILVEKLLYNLGYQSNLAPRIRQDLNLFALLVPELQLFAPGEKLDRDYLVPGITNQPLFSSLFATVLAHADPIDVRDANEFVKSPSARTFIVDFWSALYDRKNFIAFMAIPFDGSDWRREALLTLNRLWFLDSMQAATLRLLAPLLLSRLRVSPDSPRVASIETLASSLAFFRTAWASRTLTDEDLYALTVESRQPAVARSMALIAGSFGTVCQELAQAMDAALPRDLSGFKRTALDSLKKQAP